MQLHIVSHSAATSGSRVAEQLCHSSGMSTIAAVSSSRILQDQVTSVFSPQRVEKKGADGKKVLTEVVLKHTTVQTRVGQLLDLLASRS